MFNTLIAYAESTQAQQTAPQGGFAEMLVTFLPMIVVFVVLYWLMIRPQKKQQKQQQEMRANLKVGDKIVTVGGICGKVVKIKDEHIWIESSLPGAPENKSNIKLLKNAVETVSASKE